MKKIKLTESQYNKLILNESSYNQIVQLMGSKLKSGKGTLSTSELSSIADSIYDAIKGMGTDEDAIAAGLGRCKNLHDVQALAKTFNSNTGETLIGWLDGDIDSEGDWNRYVLRPIRNAYNASKSQGHFEVKKENKVEQDIIQKFPCLKDTPGYAFYKSDDARGILYFKAGEGDYYGVKPDGTLYKYDQDQNKYIAFPEKTKCVGAQYTSIDELKLHDIAEYGDTHEYGDIDEAGLNLNPGGPAPEPEKKPEEKPQDNQGGGEEPAAQGNQQGGEEQKPVVQTRLMTGSDVSEIQKMLHDAGLGEIVGSIDGKLGKKTLAGIKEFLLGANRPKIEKLTAIKPKGVQPLDVNKPSGIKLAETNSLNESQKRFKRLIR